MVFLHPIALAIGFSPALRPIAPDLRQNGDIGVIHELNLHIASVSRCVGFRWMNYGQVKAVVGVLLFRTVRGGRPSIERQRDLTSVSWKAIPPPQRPSTVWNQENVKS